MMRINLTHQKIKRKHCQFHDPEIFFGWKCYRVEYGFECGCPEGIIWLPPEVDPLDFETELEVIIPLLKAEAIQKKDAEQQESEPIPNEVEVPNEKK